MSDHPMAQPWGPDAERIAELEAQCAAMRQLLWRWAPIFCDHDVDCAVQDGTGAPCNCGRDPHEQELFDAALSSDAGKALLERLEKAEADLAEVDDDRMRDRDRWQARAEKAERIAAHAKPGDEWDRMTWDDALEKAAKVAEETIKGCECQGMPWDYLCPKHEISAAIRALKNGSAPEPAYSCNRCGKTLTKAESGSVFTVCEVCWDARKNGGGT